VRYDKSTTLWLYNKYLRYLIFTGHFYTYDVLNGSSCLQNVIRWRERWNILQTCLQRDLNSGSWYMWPATLRVWPWRNPYAKWKGNVGEWVNEWDLPTYRHKISFSVVDILSSYTTTGRLGGHGVAWWTTDHYHPCSKFGVGMSEGCFIFDFATLP